MINKKWIIAGIVVLVILVLMSFATCRPSVNACVPKKKKKVCKEENSCEKPKPCDPPASRCCGYNGRDGKDGKDGCNGRDGKDGCNGRDGKNGSNGCDGKNGRDGCDGKNGCNGKDGKDCECWNNHHCGGHLPEHCVKVCLRHIECKDKSIDTSTTKVQGHVGVSIKGLKSIVKSPAKLFDGWLHLSKEENKKTISKDVIAEAKPTDDVKTTTDSKAEVKTEVKVVESKNDSSAASSSSSAAAAATAAPSTSSSSSTESVMLPTAEMDQEYWARVYSTFDADLSLLLANHRLSGVNSANIPLAHYVINQASAWVESDVASVEEVRATLWSLLFNDFVVPSSVDIEKVEQLQQEAANNGSFFRPRLDTDLFLLIVVPVGKVTSESETEVADSGNAPAIAVPILTEIQVKDLPLPLAYKQWGSLIAATSAPEVQSLVQQTTKAYGAGGGKDTVQWTWNSGSENLKIGQFISNTGNAVTKNWFEGSRLAATGGFIYGLYTAIDPVKGKPIGKQKDLSIALFVNGEQQQLHTVMCENDKVASDQTVSIPIKPGDHIAIGRVAGAGKEISPSSPRAISATVLMSHRRVTLM